MEGGLASSSDSGSAVDSDVGTAVTVGEASGRGVGDGLSLIHI